MSNELLNNWISTIAMDEPFTQGIISHDIVNMHNTSQMQGGNFMFTRSRSRTQELVLYYNNIRTYIWTYIPPVILTIGVFCNFLSLLVWIRSLLKKRGSSSSYFFACLSIGDILALLFLPMYDHIGKAYYNGVNLRNHSDFTCKFYMFMFAFSLSFPSYILAFPYHFSVCRLLSLCYPRNSNNPRFSEGEPV